jgi:hypothetical protein
MEDHMTQHWGELHGEDHPHMEVTEAIIGAAIKVQKALGPGLLEDAYKVCLAHTLRLEGHKAMQEVRLDITYEGLCIPNAYVMDLVIDDKEVGLLLNFRAWPLKEGIKRVVNTHHQCIPPRSSGLSPRLRVW